MTIFYHSVKPPVKGVEIAVKFACTRNWVLRVSVLKEIYISYLRICSESTVQ